MVLKAAPAPLFTLFEESPWVLASDHPLPAHQTPILASHPNGCLCFPKSVLVGSDLNSLQGPCYSQLWALLCAPGWTEKLGWACGQSSLRCEGLTGPSAIFPDCLSPIHLVQQTSTTRQLLFVSSENIPREAGGRCLCTAVGNSQCGVRAGPGGEKRDAMV